jgi:hypothetical protein
VTLTPPNLYLVLRANTAWHVDPFGDTVVVLWYGRGSGWGRGEGFGDLATKLQLQAIENHVGYKLIVVDDYKKAEKIDTLTLQATLFQAPLAI